MKIHARFLLTSLFCGLLAVARGQIVAITLEEHNRQTGTSTTSTTEYVGYATIEDVDGVTGGTVSSPSGLSADLETDGSIHEYSVSHSTASGLTTAFPLNADYTLTATGDTSGDVIINGPGGAFADYKPTTTIFTISDGVTGTWSGSTFSFNPSGVTSFTVTIGSYEATSPGGHYGSFFQVADVTGTYTEIGEVGTGPDVYTTPFTPPEALVFTFTNGAALDGGDDDDSTYGFTAGTRLELEAGFFNVIGLTDSGLGDVGDADKAFMIGSTTSFTLAAIPEPSTYAAIFGVLALAGVVIHRRRRAV